MALAPQSELSVDHISRRCLAILAERPGMVFAGLTAPWLAALPLQLPSLLVSLTTPSPSPLVAMSVTVADLGSILVALFIQLGSTHLFVRLARGEAAGLPMLVGEVRSLVPGLIATLLLALALAVGLTLLVPGIVLALGLQLTLHALVDQRLGPIAALQESWRLTHGKKVRLLGLALTLALLLLGMSCLTLGVGALVCLPVVSFVQAVIYCELQPAADSR